MVCEDLKLIIFLSVLKKMQLLSLQIRLDFSILGMNLFSTNVPDVIYLLTICTFILMVTFKGCYTLLLNEGIPRGYRGKKLRLKIPRVLPSIFELFLVFQIWGQYRIGGQYLQNINALIFWYKYLQKVNAMPSDFWWKKTSFAPLINIF